MKLVAPRRFKLLGGHVLDVLESIPLKSVQCAITSPPYYGLRGYNTEPQVWGGVDYACAHSWSKLLPGKRQRWGNLDTLSAKQRSNRGSASNVRAMERDGGRECDACGAWLGELGQEPTLALYAYHLRLVAKEVWKVLRDDGLFFLNLGDSHCYTPEDGIKPKDLYGMPWRVADALRRDGWYLRNAICWYKPNAMPRSVIDVFTPTYELVFMLSKSPRYYFDVDAVKVNGNMARDVWTIPNKTVRNSVHTAAFPVALAERCIMAASKPGDWILDPFMGSGTVGEAALTLLRRVYGVELNAEFRAYTKQRLGNLQL